MIILKACPRCVGDLFSGLDDELSCIQCGKEVGAEERTQLLQRVRRLPQPAAPADRAA